MSISPLDNRLHAGLLGDPAVAELLGEVAEIAAMIGVERALAETQTRLGIIPAEQGRALAAALSQAKVEPETLSAGLARDGVAAPALLAALRPQIPIEAAAWLHWGMTSQDLTDLALVLRLRDVLDLFDHRLLGLIGQLSTLARAHVDTPCLARTRMQAASPTVFGLKVAQWMAPLVRHRERIAQLRPRLLAVQLGGAAGNLSAFGDLALPLMDALADHLALSRAEPWHKGRDRIEELGSVLAMIATSLGTIGADLALLAQSEVGEVGFAGAGGSSTLPQKQNPVLAEILVGLGRFAAGQAGVLHQAGIHANERDGAAWALEWLALPPLVLATGAGLLRASEAIASLRVDAARMQANLDATRGLVLSEAANFALAMHMPRPAAAALVKQAVEATLDSSGHLVDHLAQLTDAPVDWQALRKGDDMLRPARALAARLIAAVDISLKGG